MTMLIIEGMALCFILLVICVAGMANGPTGLVVFYEKNVQQRVVELGYTTKEKIRKASVIVYIALLVPMFFLIPFMVYFINGASDFLSGFVQMTVLLLIMGLFDRLFIDGYWVGHTKAWIIPGTEDLMPYIPTRTLIVKWTTTLVGYPLCALLLALLMSLFIK